MAKNEMVTLHDGTQIGLTRPDSLDDATWAQVKEYLIKNPQNAKVMQKSVQDITDNPNKMEQFREVMALAEVMKNDQNVPQKFQSLIHDPQLAPAFQEMKTGGMGAVMKYYSDENFLRLVSQKMGGVPKEMLQAMQNIHECIRNGDLASLQKHLANGTSANAKDEKGISAMHYAVGVNRLDILKTLMDAGADAKAVDNEGNTLLHYAAGYGHNQTTDYFVQLGLPVNATNRAGETPLDLALRNNHSTVVAVLRSKGAQPGRK